MREGSPFCHRRRCYSSREGASKRRIFSSRDHPGNDSNFWISDTEFVRLNSQSVGVRRLSPTLSAVGLARAVKLDVDGGGAGDSKSFMFELDSAAV